MSVVPLVANVYTWDEMVTLARWAGWSGETNGQDNVAIAVAVAFHESSFNRLAGNYCCHGLWQVNVLAHTQYTIAQMQNPEENARAAFEIWHGSGGGRTGWLNWQTYEEGDIGNGYETGNSYNQALAVVTKNPGAAFGPSPTNQTNALFKPPSASPAVAGTALDYSGKIRQTGKGASERGNNLQGHAAAIRNLAAYSLKL